METREFNSVLTKIRIEINKFGGELIVVSYLDGNQVEISNPNWSREIECTSRGLRKLIGVGYFSIENKIDLNSFLNHHLKSISLKINSYTLLKEYRSKGMKYHFPTILLLGGLLSIAISFYLYFFDLQSSGTFSYNRTGNSILSSNNTISWFHALIIGMALILSCLGGKVYLVRIKKSL